jgi:hypothetical protein
MTALEKKFNCFSGDMIEYCQDADHLWYETEEVKDFCDVTYWVSEIVFI